MTKQKESFVCLRLARDDFRAAGYDPASLSESDMQHIADEIGESCTGDFGTFWLALEESAEAYKLPELKQTK